MIKALRGDKEFADPCSEFSDREFGNKKFFLFLFI